jgi:hypothetical protein
MEDIPNIRKEDKIPHLVLLWIMLTQQTSKLWCNSQIYEEFET